MRSLRESIRKILIPKQLTPSSWQREDFSLTRHVSIWGLRIRATLWIVWCTLFLFSLFLSLTNLPSSDKTLILLDTSLSMAVEDIATLSGWTISRFEASKNLIRKLVHTPGEYGLMTFAKNPILRSPITDNTDFLENSINTISLVDQTSGTDIESALARIRKLYITSGVRLLLITDGWGEIDASMIDHFGTELEIIGIGTKAWGNIPSGNDVFGKPLYKMQDGELVRSTRNTRNIETLADLFHATTTNIEWESDIKTYINHASENRLNSSNSAKSKPYLLILWVFCILVSHFIPRYSLRSYA